MVFTSRKWLCGCGEQTYYYCSICGTPYESFKEAAECEASHRKKGE